MTKAILRPAVRTSGGATRFLRSSPLGLVSALLLLSALAIAVLADVVAPFDPLENNYALLVKPPSPLHLMGTDGLGRDVLSRIIFGTRISLLVACSAVLLGDTLGFVIGLTGGFAGGRVELITQRLIDVLMAFPALILALLLMAGLGPGLHTVVIAIAITHIPRSCRIARSVALSAKEMVYVEAARVVGASPLRIMVRHVAPQCMSPMLVAASLGLGSAIFAEAALSFLGAGVPPPQASLGNMLGEQIAQQFNPPWWLVVFPGLGISLVILAANLFGDALRDYMDPRLRK